MRPRTEIAPLGDECLEPCAAASMTKVSKPVLFALKMTDFQCAHKQDSLLVKLVPAHSFWTNPRPTSRPTRGRQPGSSYPPKFTGLRKGRAPPPDRGGALGSKLSSLAVDDLRRLGLIGLGLD